MLPLMKGLVESINKNGNESENKNDEDLD